MTPLVIPAKAGIQSATERATTFVWTPAFAGVTV
jgi:hypothetical protein